ncbi:MAG: energy-coupled thiamine transporter ThiT [Eubacteriales bacterium]|nr:energy-coupled thiamine transporter ThiT [Eubacteriales bacterium]
MKNNSHLKLRALCEGALLIAAAQILGYIKIFALPNGGSITLNMLPIFIYCSRWGFGYGILASFVLSLLQLMLDGAYAWGWQSIIGDYILAYTVIGLAGLFHKRKYGFFSGILAGSAARFIISYIVGATVWGEYMPEHFFGMTMTTPWFYSALYNGSYIFACMFLDLVVAAILFKPLNGFITGKDLRLK